MSQKKFLFYISQNYSFAILRPLQEVALARGDTVVWFLEGSQVNSAFLDDNEVSVQSVASIFDYKPDVIVYTANTAPTFLPGINVMVFHGFDAGKVDKRGRNDHFKIRNCFDLYCTQGPSSTLPFKRLKAKNDDYRVVETGWCALDPLYRYSSGEGEKTKPEILLCSTFSKALSCAPHLYETIKALSLKGNWHWHIQFHPKMNKETVEQYKSLQSANLTFHETDDVLPLLKQADVMVCDTSSVLMMFLLLNKPVVTFNNINPGKYLIDIDDPSKLEESIYSALQRPVKLMNSIEEYTAITHPYQDGNSAQRVLDAVDTYLRDKKGIKKRKWDLFRQFKMRKKLNYWKI